MTVHDDRRLGPGRFIAVVGPSGAGKDTLLRLAEQMIADAGGGALFVQRVVTRPSSEAEQNIQMSEAEFEQAVRKGAFALDWTAHGHRYAIPVGANATITSGGTVVANLSRRIIDQLHEIYQHVTVVLIDAPRELLEARIALRGRASDGSPQARAGRTVADNFRADVVITNVGEPEIHAKTLLHTILYVDEPSPGI